MTRVNTKMLVFKIKHHAMVLFKYALEVFCHDIRAHMILSLFQKIGGVLLMKKHIKWAFGYKIYSA